MLFCNGSTEGKGCFVKLVRLVIRSNGRCQKSTKGYKDVDVKDFDKSWKDGLAFCVNTLNHLQKALLHHHTGGVHFDSLSKDEPKKNLRLAFHAADEVGIPPLIDIEDVLDDNSTEDAVITYLSEFYRFFATPSYRSSLSIPSLPSEAPPPASPLPLSNLRCKKCKKKLTGATIVFGKYMYHQKCFEVCIEFYLP